jgi:protein-tyrosine-phosphatase
MGCGDSWPVLPGRRYEDWAIADPAGHPVERVRAIRDDVDQHVQELVTELMPTGV